jgi:class 3 adenylate cyclase/tetratricopeptide (TPR) repeat protein
MDCPKCRHQNPEDAIFCNGCGHKLEIECPECGKANPPGSKFCNKCGNDISMHFAAKEKPIISQTSQHTPTGLETVSMREGERRQATIVFSDLSGYTSMNEKLDPEEVEAVMSRIKMEAAGIVERHEGIVNQFVGDEVLALFGIPAAHEDDPVRAIKAAFEIHELVRKISSEVEGRIGTRLRMHTGISTGLVVVQMRDIREGSYGITGDAVNIGARLASQAETDEILIGPDTRRLIAPYFETKRLAEVTVRGKAKPIIPYLVAGKLAVQTRFEAAEKMGFTAFTGREHELTVLHSCVTKMLSGKGQFVTVIGEAGLGKSRLVYEFRHNLNKSEITVLQGRCQAYGTSIPYFSFINALRRGLNLHDEDTPAELHEKAISNVLTIDPSLEQYLPLYLHLLSIPSETYPLPKHLHGQELTNAIQKALAAINILNSKRKPYVVILEDWHWADEASDLALKHIISVIASHPVMVLVIYRPEYAANWGHWSHHTPITLRALDTQDCNNIIHSVWGTQHLPQEISLLIYERTGGNPFFVEEISSALIEEGQVQITNQKAVLTQSIEYLSLPNTVQSVIRARLDRLDRFSRESLRLASVIGREFAHRILERISSSKDRLAKSLEELKILELIQQIRVMPEAEYMFKHVITQEVTYETLLLQKRRELHGLVGLAMEELYQDRIEEQVNLLYRHFSLAEDWQKAAEYGRKAADRAYRLGRFQEAVTIFENTYTSLSQLPESQKRQENMVDLQFEMVWPLHFLGQQDRALKVCKQAESIANALKDPVRLCKVDYQYAISYFFINQYNNSERYFLKSLQHSQKSEMDELIHTVKFSLAANYLSIGHWEAAADLYSEVISSLEASGIQSVYFEETPFHPYTHMCHHLGYIRALQGRIDEAKELIQKGHTPALNEISNLQTRAYCSLWHSTVSALIGEDYGALDRVNEVIKIAEETDSPILCYLCYAAKGNALIAANQFEAAKEISQKSLLCIENTTHRRYLEAVYYNLVRASLELGHWDDANHYHQEALPLVESNPDREAARFDFLKGRLLASGNPPEFGNALLLFEKSIQADQASGAVVLVAQTKYYLAQILVQKSEIERSRYILNEIKGMFENWGIPFWQKKCEQALDTI